MHAGNPEAVVLALYGDIASAAVSGSLPNSLTLTELISTALFADGAAASLVVGSAVADRYARFFHRALPCGWQDFFVVVREAI